MKFLNIDRCFLLLACIFSVIQISCTREQEQNLADIDIEEDVLLASAEGGIMAVNYQIAGYDADIMLQPETNAGWIHDFDTSVPGKVIFTVDKNTQTVGREASLVLYGLEKQICDSVVVRQSAGDGSGDSFKIELVYCTEGMAQVSVEPKDPGMTYLLMAVEKEFRDGFESGEDMMVSVKEDLEKKASESDMSLSQYLKDNLLVGEQVQELIRLAPATDYCAFAIGMDYDGNLISGMDETAFTTAELEMNDMDFDISYNVDGPFVEMTVTPSNDIMPYFFSLMEKSLYDSLNGDIAGPLQEALWDEIAFALASSAMNVDEIVLSMSSYGMDTFSANLRADTEYVGYAFGWTVSGTINTAVVTGMFTTGSVPPSDNEFQLEVVSTNVTSARVNIITSNNDPYVLLPVDAEEWGSLSDEEILSELTSGSYNLDYYSYSGDYSGRVTGLESDHEYLLLVFGYQAGTATTGLTKCSFKTLPAVPADNIIFSFEISDITPKGATVSVTPDPLNALYFWGVASSDMLENDIDRSVDETVEYYISLGYVKDRVDYMRQAGTYGEDIYLYDNLYSNSSYRPYAFGVDESTGERITDIYFGETFTTLPPVYSNTSIELEYGPYYDGYQVAMLFPQFANASGSAILPVDVKVSGVNAQSYYYNVYKGDLTNVDEYPDERILEVLPFYGIQDEPSHDFILRYDEVVTIVGVVMDTDGMFSRMFREKIIPTQSGVSPADEFNPADYRSISSLMENGKRNFAERKIELKKDIPELEFKLKKTDRSKPSVSKDNVVKDLLLLKNK